MIPSSPREKLKVIICSVTNWHEPPRFRKQVAKEVSKYFDVIYIERNKPECLASFNNGFQPIEEKVDENILRVVLPSISMRLPRVYTYLPFLHSFFDYIDLKRIEKYLARDDGEKYFLLNFQYDFHTFARQDYLMGAVYICNDDFTSGRSHIKEIIKKNYEKKTVAKSNAVIVHSEALQKKIKSYGRADVILMYPGHSFRIQKTLDKHKDNSINNDKIHVCYMGYVDRRIDKDWLVAISSDSRFSLHIIGPIKSGCEDYVEFFEKLSVNWSGALYDDELQDSMLEMDVFIIPFDVQHPIVKSCTPNKLYPYIACGKPVVASDMFFPDTIPKKFIKICKDVDILCDTIAEQHAFDSNDLVKERCEFAINNHWKNRGETLKKIIDEIVE